MTSQIAEAYDTFENSSFDPAKWQFLQYPMPDQEPWTCCEPQARISASDGRLNVEIDRFELEHAVQVIDNCKFVLLSTETFPVPSEGTLVISGDMAAEGVNTVPYDWADAFACLVVIDPTTGWVFDVCANSDAVGAIHELLPMSPDVNAFTHLVEAPLASPATRAGSTHRCQITLDAQAHLVTWSVAGREIYRVGGVYIPASVHLGLGIFTLRPVGEAGSRSLHGQGFKASWSNLTVTTV